MDKPIMKAITGFGRRKWPGAGTGVETGSEMGFDSLF
jgi:hypothetical protein